MKRLLLLLIVLVAPAAFGAPAADRDVLLTKNGTLYSIETAYNRAAAATGYLALTVQKGGDTDVVAVPASLRGGTHWRPKLAYDGQSDTLFIFWLRSQTSLLSTSELVFCSYQNGKFNDVTAVDEATPYQSRSNLSVGVTNRIETLDDQNRVVVVPGLTLHVVWWNEAVRGNSAEYAMLTVEGGNVTDVDKRPLSDFLDSRFESAGVTPADTLELYRHPTVFESASRETVDVVYGDPSTNKFHRVTVRVGFKRATPNLRVRIPINVRERGFRGPKHPVPHGVRVSALPVGDSGVAFYYEANEALNYVMYRDNAWTPVNSIALSNNMTADVAIEALRRMVGSEQ